MAIGGRPKSFQRVEEDQSSADEEATARVSVPPGKYWFATVFVMFAGATCIAPWLYRHRPTELLSASFLSAESLEAWASLNNFVSGHAARDEALPLGAAGGGGGEIQCSVDVLLSSKYLGQAVVWLDRVLAQGGGHCLGTTEPPCQLAFEAAATAFSWLTEYLSLASTACAKSAVRLSPCVGDGGGLVTALEKLHEASAVTFKQCGFSARRSLTQPDNVVQDLLSLNKLRGMVEGQSAGPGSAMARCNFDAAQGASCAVRAVAQFMDPELQRCGDPRACEVGAARVVSSFDWVSKLLSLAVGDCGPAAGQAQGCTGSIAALASGALQLSSALGAAQAKCDASWTLSG